MGIEEKCTVIIPTYQRPEFLERSLQYYKELRIRSPLIISDGGNDEIRHRNKEIANKYNSSILKIKYIQPETPTDFSDQINFALQNCTTPYAVLISDDDFLGKDYICSAVNFLDNHEEYSGVCGYRIAFKVDSDGPYGKIIYQRRSEPPSCYADTASERIYYMEQNHYHKLQTYNLLEVVRRTKDCKELFHNAVRCKKIYNKYGFKRYTLATTFVDELLTTHITLAQGKLHRINKFNVGMQFHSNSTGKKVFDDIDAVSVFTSDSWSKYYREYKKILSNIISDNDKIDPSEAERKVEFFSWLRMSYFLNKAISTRKYALEKKCFPSRKLDIRIRIKRKIDAIFDRIHFRLAMLNHSKGIKNIPNSNELIIMKKVIEDRP